MGDRGADATETAFLAKRPILARMLACRIRGIRLDGHERDDLHADADLALWQRIRQCPHQPEATSCEIIAKATVRAFLRERDRRRRHERTGTDLDRLPDPSPGPATDPATPWLTAHEAASRLRISRQRVHQLRHALQAVRIGHRLAYPLARVEAVRHRREGNERGTPAPGGPTATQN